MKEKVPTSSASANRKGFEGANLGGPFSAANSGSGKRVLNHWFVYNQSLLVQNLREL